MENKEPTLSDSDKYHIQVMKNVLAEISNKDTGLVLKGGGCMMFRYGSDRPSEDLDFDSLKDDHLEINLDNKIKSALKKVGAKCLKIFLKKNSNTAKNYHITYQKDGTEEKRKLKIEISLRTPPKADDYSELDGVLYSNLSRILDGKFHAIEHREKARDVYDVLLIAENYPEAFSKEQISQLRTSSEQIENMLRKYSDTYKLDRWLEHRIDLDEMLLRLALSGELMDDSITAISNIAKEMKSEERENEPLHAFRDEIRSHLESKTSPLDWKGIENNTVAYLLKTETPISQIKDILVSNSLRQIMLSVNNASDIDTIIYNQIKIYNQESDGSYNKDRDDFEKKYEATHIKPDKFKLPTNIESVIAFLNEPNFELEQERHKNKDNKNTKLNNIKNR